MERDLGIFESGHCPVSRRDFFSHVRTGVCGAALLHLLQQDLRSDDSSEVADLRPRRPPLPARAKSVIHLFMNGGPSQMDLFDPKPELDRHHGESYFDKIAGEVENVKDAGALMRSPFKFAQHGGSGMWVSDALPHIARHVDELTLVRSMYTTNITHEPALYLIQTNRMVSGYPTLGSWITYGLGSESQNLPAYVVLDDPLGLPINGTENWHSGFLPPIYQGTRFRSTGSPVLNLRPEQEEPRAVVDMQRDLLRRLDRMHLSRRPDQPKLQARISTYELAARMQLSASEALDLSAETAATQSLYGIGQPTTDSYGRRCLIARRLVERGVRFVQLFINAQIWDNHTGLATDMKAACDRTDLPIAGLLQDLKQRGLLEDTLVIWGGEFGRLPIAQLSADKDERKSGRDHNKNAGCLWMAGGGVRKGFTYGVTDELGFAAVEDRVSVPDWHATILHLLGLNHDELSVDQHGLREKLTGVLPAKVIHDLIEPHS
ncbi:DUF1501 domain-containing protein [Schlesneria paludicola]|uniref:DUF1501 domain-containing protein n=1 Tax=Schlesneria paludicola TaxID=360056 RepID=UPI00029A42E2|nr:DUF1501 domain-containing protein [Schlesneria paludicola]